MTGNDFRDVIAVGAKARPKRVAFILDPSDVTLADVDELAYKCSTHWGGGYWPIVPSDGNDIDADWWKILEAVDPDIVLHVPPLSATLEDRIHRRLAPAKLLRIANDESGKLLRIDLHDVNALDSYDTLGYRAARRTPLPDLQFMAIEDSAEPAPDRAFALRNFGLLRPSLQTKSSLRAVETQSRKVDDLSKSEVLKWLLGCLGDVVVPKDLGILSAPRPFDTEYDQPFSGFTLIVGDSIDEALFAWNRTLLSRGHFGRDALWIDSASAREPEFLGLIGKWIQRYFWNNQQQQKGTVISYTEELAFLQGVAESLRQPTFMYWEGARLIRGDFPTRIRPAWGGLYREPWESAPRTVEHIPLTAWSHWNPPSGLLTIPRPLFLGSRTGLAGWMVDLDIEYTLDPRRYDNASDRWRVPRIARLGNLFATGRELSRIQRQHEPCVSVRANEQSIALTIPSKSSLLRRLLEPLPLSDRPRNKNTGDPVSKYGEVRTSEQGRRFRGLVDLLGGVASAGRLFDNTFWRTVLLDAIGKPTDDVGRLADIVQREVAPLFAAFAELPAGETVEQRLQELRLDEAARRIGSALHKAKAQPHTLTSTDLEARYPQLTREIVQDEKGSRRPRFDKDAKDTFEWLVETGALLQGIVVSCPQCGTEQWRAVDDLARVLRCRDCTADFPLPLDPAWRYRVNGLIRDGITRHGVLPVLHTAWKLTDRARAMMITFAPQELREHEDGPIVTDLDIVILRDGEFILGEVKSSPKAFQPAQMSVLETVAKETRPNRFVLAAPGKEWPAEVWGRFQEFENALVPFDVKVEALLLDW